MPALQDSFKGDAVEPETPTVAVIRLVRAATAPALARRHVERALAAPSGRLRDMVLLTSEVVTNAVEYSRGDAVEIAVVSGSTVTRVEISNPGHSWDRRPEPRSTEPGEVGGWGLFLIEQLSDRWGIRDRNSTVWFEFDRPAPPFRRVFRRP